MTKSKQSNKYTKVLSSVCFAHGQVSRCDTA